MIKLLIFKFMYIIKIKSNFFLWGCDLALKKYTHFLIFSIVLHNKNVKKKIFIIAQCYSQNFPQVKLVLVNFLLYEKLYLVFLKSVLLTN